MEQYPDSKEKEHDSRAEMYLLDQRSNAMHKKKTKEKVKTIIKKPIPDKCDKNDTKAYKKKILIQSLSTGVSVSDACLGADICRDSFYEWLKQDKHFAQAVETAKRSRCVVLEDAMHSTAIGGNATMQIFLACRFYSKSFIKDRQIFS